MKIRRRQSVSFLATALLISIFFLNIKSVNADTNQFYERPYNRILFVIDCSNSMNFNDGNKLTNEIIKMFVDGTESSKTDIGFVTYNDRILKTYELTPMNEVVARDTIKSEIDGIERAGSTDIGMALNYGMDMLMKNPKENERPIMILFSDGETDLTYTKTGRTNKDSQNDEAAAFEKSKQLNCPIYSIGISKDGKLNTNYLHKIADSTKGKSYEMQNPNELLDLFYTLYTDATKTPVILSQEIKGTGANQNIDIPILKDFASETNIIIQHNKSLGEIIISHGSNNISVYNSKSFSSLKVVDPTSDKVTLNFSTAVNDDIKINVINFIGVLPKVENPEQLSEKDVPITAHLYNAKDSTLAAASLYQNFAAELIITDTAAGHEERIPMDNTGSEFAAIYNNEAPKTYMLSVVVTGDNYNERSMVKEINFTNHAPEQSTKGTIKVLKQEKEKQYNLDEYFNDIDGDTLSYEVLESSQYMSKPKINNHALTIMPAVKSTEEVKINVSDERGGQMTAALVFDIMPFWIYYKTQVVTIGCIFIALLTLFLIFAKKTGGSASNQDSYVIETGTRFRGARFEGYFLNTLSGKDIPILHWNAAYLDNKRSITLGDLFAILDVKERLPEAYKIILEPGNNETVVFSHHTHCVVTLGNKEIAEGKKESLRYEDKLYITFEDGVTEIELRYKRVRKLVRI